jgi:hypothetical protein
MNTLISDNTHSLSTSFDYDQSRTGAQCLGHLIAHHFLHSAFSFTRYNSCRTERQRQHTSSCLTYSNELDNIPAIVSHVKYDQRIQKHIKCRMYPPISLPNELQPTTLPHLSTCTDSLYSYRPKFFWVRLVRSAIRAIHPVCSQL